LTSASGGQVIRVDGMHIVPGFIDIHLRCHRSLQSRSLCVH
jgi:imidazolonepropionase-like amidohydrolase